MMTHARDTNRRDRAAARHATRTDLLRPSEEIGKGRGSKKFASIDVTDGARRTQVGEGRADQHGHGGIRTEERDMQQDKQRKASGKSSRRSKASPRSSDRATAEVRNSEYRERLEQVSFRVRPELKTAILDEARRRRSTVQTFILRGCPCGRQRSGGPQAGCAAASEVGRADAIGSEPWPI
jgi:hypothetical protein